MELTIKGIMEATEAAFKKSYGKVAAASFLLVMLSYGVSSSSLIRSINQIPELVQEIVTNEFAAGRNWDFRMVAVLLTMAGGMLLLSLLVKFLLDVFLENPLRIGADKMMLDALGDEQPVKLASLAFAFDADYINTVRVMFFRSLFLNLWTMLLIVPGMVKSYEYLLIPYLMSENPYQTSKEAFQKSRELMHGYKRKAFLLDLYFLPWQLLGIFTLGVLNIFYVEPKRNLVKAELYRMIKENSRKGEEN